ncbi:hypothetical protein DFP97_102446 [Paenibacillus prosopidis]|uniref:Uncharacterized protein n=1 Tax=Paenibacillus prosopidis TaxID=630520 RepID=A0A368WBJ2_9BACL|nr:hypothetical protein DFP97_102446 [Paenibacillus prosopidis]
MKFKQSALQKQRIKRISTSHLVVGIEGSDSFAI